MKEGENKEEAKKRLKKEKKVMERRKYEGRIKNWKKVKKIEERKNKWRE